MSSSGEGMKTPRILIVGEFELFCLGLKYTIESTEVGCAEIVLDKDLSLNMLLDEPPDVVLLDSNSFDESVVQYVSELKSRTAAGVMLMIDLNIDLDVRALLSCGLDAFCGKTITPQQLAFALKSVAAGSGWMDPNIAGRLVNLLEPRRPVPKKASPCGPFELTSREREVMTLVAEGATNPQIGQKLFISPETVKTHVSHIMEKLLVRDRTAAVVKAMQLGLIAV